MYERKPDGPWKLPDRTKMRHKKYGWEVIYEYDHCYEDWFLWNGRSLMVLDDWRPDEFEIIKEV